MSLSSYYLPPWHGSPSGTTTSTTTTTTTALVTATVLAGLGLWVWWSSSSLSLSPPSQQQQQGRQRRRALDANTTATEVLQLYLPPRAPAAGATGAPDTDTVQEEEDERVYVFTGTTSGLGRHCALLLLRSTSTTTTTTTTATNKCHIITGARTKERAKEFQDEFQQELMLHAATTKQQGGGQGQGGTGTEANIGKLTVFVLDLSSLQSVRDFCSEVTTLMDGRGRGGAGRGRGHGASSSSSSFLTAIVNNAGCYKTAGVTMDGYQTTWQTNCLAPALLTELLLPLLHPQHGRVIHVSSELHKFGFIFLLSSLSSLSSWNTTNDATRVMVERHCPPTSNGASQVDYGFSKACQILHATYLQKVVFDREEEGEAAEGEQQSSNMKSKSRHGRGGRRVFAVDPGLVQTNIARHASPLAKWWDYSVMGYFLLRTVDQGAATILYCLLAPLQELDDDDDDGDDGTSDDSRSDKQNGSRNIYFAACRPQLPLRACLDVQGAMALDQVFRKLWNRK